MNIKEKIAKFLAPNLRTEKEVIKEVRSRMKAGLLPQDFDPKNEGYRRITGLGEAQRRDLSAVDQSKMFEVAYYMYSTSTITKRLCEMDKEFLFSEDITVTSEDKVVQQIFDDFFERNDFVNRFPTNMMWLSLLGEQLYPVEVDKDNGAVTIKYIDPALIENVYVERDNVLVPKYVQLQSDGYVKKDIKYNIISIDNDIQSPTYNKYIGDCFFFALNHPPNSPRGISDYWTLFDWIDGVERYGFLYFERAETILNFIWDVLLEGYTDDEITNWLKKTKPPKAGTIRAHNEKVKWQTVAPTFQAWDYEKGLDMGLSLILGARGRPRSWFGQGGKSYQLEAEQQDQVPAKALDMRQKEHGRILKNILDFVIDQAIIAKKIIKKDREAIKYDINLPEISKKNFIKGVTVLPQGIGSIMSTTEYVDDETIIRLLGYVFSQVGYELDVDELIKKKAVKDKNKLDSTLNYPDIPDFDLSDKTDQFSGKRKMPKTKSKLKKEIKI